MRTVVYEAFKVCILNSMLLQDVYYGQLESLLRVRGLILHVTDIDCHDLPVLGVIHMNTHSGLVRNPLDMVEHDPFVLQITSWLHLPHKANSTPLTTG